MSNKLYIGSFICLLLSMSPEESFSWSDLESGKQMDAKNRIHSMTGYSQEGRVKINVEMVLCGRNLFNTLRVACSSIRRKRFADAFSEERMGKKIFGVTLRNEQGSQINVVLSLVHSNPLLSFC
ncbi:unnamed protein product [Lepeophtheirus salmonis]|uniref:(salmon louse) hypothetical protein n=1 Tax=Lepeophtheirus salmonis TaxID=72036 RepID=A0A7R8D755_LEPSM|nr:unnamed protein product [Lepeophtheirus salmonis]CAF3024269.1 unnamed protein product [Lepeophtheirus salmonis]